MYAKNDIIRARNIEHFTEKIPQFRRISFRLRFLVTVVQINLCYSWMTNVTLIYLLDRKSCNHFELQSSSNWRECDRVHKLSMCVLLVIKNRTIVRKNNGRNILCKTKIPDKLFHIDAYVTMWCSLFLRFSNMVSLEQANSSDAILRICDRSQFE